jgi:hypothetical protein
MGENGTVEVKRDWCRWLTNATVVATLCTMASVILVLETAYIQRFTGWCGIGGRFVSLIALFYEFITTYAPWRFATLGIGWAATMVLMTAGVTALIFHRGRILRNKRIVVGLLVAPLVLPLATTLFVRLIIPGVFTDKCNLTWPRSMSIERAEHVVDWQGAAEEYYVVVTMDKSDVEGFFAKTGSAVGTKWFDQGRDFASVDPGDFLKGML